MYYVFYNNVSRSGSLSHPPPHKKNVEAISFSPVLLFGVLKLQFNGGGVHQTFAKLITV